MSKSPWPLRIAGSALVAVLAACATLPPPSASPPLGTLPAPSAPPPLGTVPAPSAAPTAAAQDPCQTFNEKQSAVGGETAADVPMRTTVHLLSITPQAANDVQRDTLVFAELNYAIRDFQPGRFFIIAQLETLDPDVTWDGVYSPRVELNRPSGKVTFCFPLVSVWDSPRMKWPLSIKFLLNEPSSRGSSHSLAQTTATEYTSTNLPFPGRDDAAIQNERSEYFDVLNRVHGYVERVVVTQTICSDRYPELRELIATAYQKWGVANADLRRTADESFLKHEVAVFGGRRDLALKNIAGQRDFLYGFLRARPDKEIRATCEGFPASLANEGVSPAERFSNDLAVIRDYEQRHPDNR